jgi:TatA/E family protein of Tat protein translocase
VPVRLAYHAAVDILLVLIVILVVVLMWRGPKNLPEIGRVFGRGVKEARSEAREIQSDLRGHGDEDRSTQTDDAPRA